MKPRLLSPTKIRSRTDSTILLEQKPLLGKLSDYKTKQLPQQFYNRPADRVAPNLLGKCLIRVLPNGEILCWPITEVEAYLHERDLASHASKGRTARNEVMFGPAGFWYLYFIYGMYWMLNVVTSEQEQPAAVLIRGAGPADGPGKLTKQLQLDRELNYQSATSKSSLWIADLGLKVPRSQIRRTARIGVDYAGIWKDKPLRWVWV